MSTVDKQTAEDVINGEYPEDNYYSIIIYFPPFPNAELAYKLCKTKSQEMDTLLSFTSRNISCSIAWRQDATLEKFNETIDIFLSSPFLKRW